MVLSRLLVSSSESFANSELVVEQYNNHPTEPQQYAGSMGVFGVGTAMKANTERMNITNSQYNQDISLLMAQAHLGHGHGKQSYLAKKRERSNTILETDAVERLQSMTNFSNPILGGNQIQMLPVFNDTGVNSSAYNSNLSISHSSINNSINNSMNNCASRSPIVPIPFLIDDRAHSIAGSYNSKDRLGPYLF
jgi:hypothetical protein